MIGHLSLDRIVALSSARETRSIEGPFEPILCLVSSSHASCLYFAFCPHPENSLAKRCSRQPYQQRNVILFPLSFHRGEQMGRLGAASGHSLS